MTVYELVDAESGEVLDRFDLDAGGAVFYETGLAEPIVAARQRLAGGPAAAELSFDGWSNGYLLTRQAETSGEDDPGGS